MTVYLLGLKLICHLFSQFFRTLGFIRRNLKDCTRTVKETSYIAIVRPTIEYAATVWDPTSQSKIKALENIQRRTARLG
jgi:hypothetical protein